MDSHGYNNKTINAKQAADAWKKFSTIIKNESSSKLQANIRALLSSKKMGERLEEFNNENAANKLQSVFRGHSGRNKALIEISKQEYENQEKKAIEAANKLQSVFRGHLGRKEATTEKAANKLQSVFRGHLGRKQATTEKADFLHIIGTNLHI